MDGVRIASALILSAHPLRGLAHPANLRALGQGMSPIGFPFGVQLVWMTMLIQVAGALGLTLRRYVVLSSLGWMFVNAMGIAIAHFPHWFVVGPGENGMEYSLLLITCFAATLLSHWPSRKESGATRSERSPALP